MTVEHESGMDAGETEALVDRLVRAGRADGPSAKALALAPVSVAALLSAPAAAAGLTPAAVAVSHVARAAATPFVLLKWVGVGALASASVLTLVSAGERERVVRPSIAVVSGTVPRPRPAPHAVKAAASTSQPSLPSVPSALPAPAVVASTPRADVAREVASLDAAQRALLDGKPDSALRVLSALEQMPGRALVPEATVLRVRALLAQGNGAEARREAERFCVIAPSSPQAAVLRALVANTEIRATPSRL